MKLYIKDLEQKISNLNAEMARVRINLTEQERTKQAGAVRFETEQTQLRAKQQETQTRQQLRAQSDARNEADYLTELEKHQLAYAALLEKITVETVDLSVEKARLEAQLVLIKKARMDALTVYQAEQDADSAVLQKLQQELTHNTEQQSEFTIQSDLSIADLNTRLQLLDTEVQQRTVELNRLNEEPAADVLNASLIDEEFNGSESDNQELVVAEDRVPLLGESDSHADHFLRQLAISRELLTRLFAQYPEPHLTIKWTIDGLNMILQLENGINGTARWATLDVLLIKLCQGAVKKSSLRPPPQNLEEMEARYRERRVPFSESIIIPRGRTLLLESNAARLRLQATAGFIEGLEHAIMSSVHITLWGVLIYELILPLIEHTQVDPWQVLDIFRRYEEVGSNSVVRFLAKLPPSITSTVLPAFILISASTLAYLHGRHAGHFSEQEYKKFVEKLKNLKVNWLKDNLGFLFSLRWVIPFSLLPPLFFESPFVLVEQWLLQEGSLTSSQSRELWSILKNFGLNHARFLQREALHTIANIAHGIALSDLKVLHAEGVSEEKLAHLILMKLEAFAILRSLGARYTLDNEARGIYQRYLKPMSRFVYANYLLWWLGYHNYLLRKPALSKVAGLFFLVWKLAKLALKVQLVRLIVRCILAAIQCPDLPYVKFGKEIPVYANKLDINCFKAILKLFRSLPGQENQSVTNLTSIIPEFDFWLRDDAGNPIAPGLTDLDLSGKYLRAFEAAQILDALEIHKNDGVDLVSVDLGKQNPSYYREFMGTNYFCYQHFEQCIFWQGMQQLAPKLSVWPNLVNFDFSNNRAGYGADSENFDSAAYKALGYELSKLTTLRTLDLSVNAMGNPDLNRTVSQAEISSIVAIMNGLGYLTQLRSLFLSGNALGLNNETESALINSLSKLTLLEYLHIRATEFGNGTLSTIDLAASIKSMNSLRRLDIGANDNLSAHGSVGLLALLDALSKKPLFEYAELRWIGLNATRKSLIIENIPPTLLNKICFLDLFLADSLSFDLPIQLLLREYLQSLPNGSEFIIPPSPDKQIDLQEFSGCMLSLDNGTIPVLVEYLPKFPNLRELSLDLACDAETIKLFANSLTSLQSLENLYITCQLLYDTNDPVEVE